MAMKKMENTNKDNNKQQDHSSPYCWEVHKFGGTSLASSECYHTVSRIVNDQINNSKKNDSKSDNDKPKRLAVVVSAMGATKPAIKTTDLLLNSVRHAANRDQCLLEQSLDEIYEKHIRCISELKLPQEENSELSKIIKSDLQDLRDIFKTISLMKWEATKIKELVSGYGELWSARIITALMNHLHDGNLHDDADDEKEEKEDKTRHKFAYVDARRCIIVDEDDVIQDGSVCWRISREKLEQVLQEEEEKHITTTVDTGNKPPLLHLIVTGYVASNTHGVATTLQRDGSDYSAAIMGRLLVADSISIWTDVDGVLSADPRRVKNAFVLPEVSYNEAMELAYFGAKVIHPKTMQPAILSDPQIPIYIRNTFNAKFPGSRIYISGTTHIDRDRCVCGFSSADDMALINVEGTGILGVRGFAKKLFEALETVGVNVVLISQASSEHTISFATLGSMAIVAKEKVEETFAKEMEQNYISAVEITAPCSIIAAVGDGMSQTTGVAGKFFTALGDAKINILAISQGCSERNISAVVKTEQSTKALRAVHAAFRLSHTTVRIGIVGMEGELGVSLLRLLEVQRKKLCQTFEIDLQVCAVVNGDQLVTLKESEDADSITTRAFELTTSDTGDTTKNLLNALGHKSDSSSDFATLTTGGISALLDTVVNEDCAHSIIFDCTANESVGAQHAEWLQAGVHVVTANSTGLSGSRGVRDAIDAAQCANGKMSAKYLREVTVGGAIPVLSTLQDLLHSGDQIRHVDGILSLSMSYIMHRIAPPPGVSECSIFDEETSRGAFLSSFSMLSPNKKNLGQACSFSEAVKEAIALGLMETDPLKDLSNEYTARCLMVLSKELGMAEMYDVQRIQMASDMLMVNVEERMGKGAVKKEAGDVDMYDENVAAALDSKMTERVAKAAKNGCVPRHVSSINVATGEISVRIVDVPCTHVFAITPPSCECIRFFTKRHKRFPLIVQGPAEGVDSTASALLAELLNLMRAKVGGKTGALSRTESSAFLV